MELPTLFTIFSAAAIALTYGHGYMEIPPARNSMWRFGFPNPPNYNDNQLFCGGRWTQILNGGECGICGDDAKSTNQPHMDGGIYANNIIGMTYHKGQMITVQVKLTASHLGYFEFRIGNYHYKRLQGDRQGKLIGTLLRQTNGETKYKITQTGHFSIHLLLPSGLTCQRCVLQWWYRTGNSWGCDEEGCGLGHGDQENFVNCADVRIH